MASGSSKQKIIQSIKDATNILVTVSADPSVDELSAALGLTIFLNKLDKHATAVFSGEVPPAIEFLQPDKTFEQTTDSLRDFIIALDKEKADHLRYKVVDDAVKIFITPYRTTINEKDLEFSQGDYNVEMVLALNVDNSNHIDAALTAHGKILHDATVATVTAGNVKSGLGSVDWHEDKISGISEMVFELVDALKSPKVTLDEQIATALLTGIVATTDRFSNNLTSPRTMTVAAELMAAGANQQLVVAKITDAEEAAAVPAPTPQPPEEEKSVDAKEEPPKNEKDTDDLGSLSISHEKRGDVDDVAEQTLKEIQEESVRAAEEKLARVQTSESLETDTSTNTAKAEDAPKAELSTELDTAESVVPTLATSSNTAISELAQPSMGGTLNATTEQAAADKAREIASYKNKTILNHGSYVGDSQPLLGESPLNAAMGEPSEPPSVDPFAANLASKDLLSQEEPLRDEPIPDILSQGGLPRVDLAAEATSLASPANSVVESAEAKLQSMLTSPQVTADMPVSSGMPVVTNDAVAPTLAELETNTTNQVSAAAPVSGLPPLPDFSTLPPLPPVPTGVSLNGLPSLTDSPATSMPTSPVNNANNGITPVNNPAPFDPSRFQIPGQNQ